MFICSCLCLAELARCFHSSPDFYHNLKRLWRFVSNDCINDHTSKEILARRLILQLHHRLEINKTFEPVV